MQEKYTAVITAIVKQKLSTGIISIFDSFQHDLYADPEDIIEIIDQVEQRFEVEFTDSEHFESTSISEIAKIVEKKRPQPMLSSFGGPIYAV